MVTEGRRVHVRTADPMRPYRRPPGLRPDLHEPGGARDADLESIRQVALEGASAPAMAWRAERPGAGRVVRSRASPDHRRSTGPWASTSLETGADVDLSDGADYTVGVDPPGPCSRLRGHCRRGGGFPFLERPGDRADVGRLDSPVAA